MLRMIQDGVKKVIYGQVNSDMVVDADWKASCLMAENCDLELVEFPTDAKQPYTAMDMTKQYLYLKGWVN